MKKFQEGQTKDEVVEEDCNPLMTEMLESSQADEEPEMKIEIKDGSFYEQENNSRESGKQFHEVTQCGIEIQQEQELQLQPKQQGKRSEEKKLDRAT